MLSAAHGVTGAYIATKVANPLLSIPLIVGLHFLGDWLPHWDVGTGLSNGQRTRKGAFWLEIGDLLLMLGLVYWFWHWGTAEIAWTALGGAVLGIAPDFLMAPRIFFKQEPSWLKPINDFHKSFHHSTPQVIFGLIPQVLVVVVIYWLK